MKWAIKHSWQPLVVHSWLRLRSLSPSPSVSTSSSDVSVLDVQHGGLGSCLPLQLCTPNTPNPSTPPIQPVILHPHKPSPPPGSLAALPDCSYFCSCALCRSVMPILHWGMKMFHPNSLAWDLSFFLCLQESSNVFILFSSFISPFFFVLLFVLYVILTLWPALRTKNSTLYH